MRLTKRADDDADEWLSLKKHAVLFGFLAFTVAWEILGRKFPQDKSYHSFANQMTVGGIPNAANVLSNFPFVIVGLFGLLSRKIQDARWTTLWVGLVLTGLGSGYYHLHPSNATLVWDRLPMSITFAAVICIFLHDALHLETPLLPAWLAYSITTVLFWAGTDDLRPYIVLQFGGMIFLLCVWIRHRRMLPGWGWVLLGYATAKVLEAGDRSIWNVSHAALSGHPWKHIAAAAGFIPLTLYRRRAA